MDVKVVSSLNACNTIYKQYEDIINSYVADFYLEDHWNKLPNIWKTALENSEVEDIQEILDVSHPITKKVYPLSLLCLRKAIYFNAISRKSTNVGALPEIFQNNKFIKFFWRGVKLKKRHEVESMSQICYKTALKTNCFHVVDVGSGLGHLSRFLSYGFGFKVVTFEANPDLSNEAPNLDSHFEKMLNTKGVDHKKSTTTIHLNKKIEYDISEDEFIKSVESAFNVNNSNLKFGIVGLHPCGDLGATLLRLYKNCPNIVFINMVSCCYMKLTLESPNYRFPLSDFCINNFYRLEYLSCELACHAIEIYIERLVESEYQKLKIHAYRAGLEYILVKVKPELKHSAVCNFKYDKNLTFREYCEKTFNKHNLEFPNKDILEFEKLIDWSWKRVVQFFTIRLLLAPVVETILLYDRLMYIKGSNSLCDIIPIFDSKISPRNHVLSATKRYICKDSNL